MIHRMSVVLAAVVSVLPAAVAQTKEDGKKEEKRTIQAFFSPDGRLLPSISAEIQRAKRTIDIAMYSLSIETIRVEKPEEPSLEGKTDAQKAALLREHREQLAKYETYRDRVEEGRLSIFDALAEAIARGVKVRLVFNEGHRGEWKTFQSEQLASIGVDLRYTTRTMHEKFGIFDDEVLITGSANWSDSAANIYNESTLVFRGYPGMVKTFQGEFDLLWERSLPYPPR